MVHIGNDWDDILAGEFDKPYYQQLRAFLAAEYKTHTIYPNMHNIFHALTLTPYSDVKVVILGQDPYHGENQAHGLAFSVQKGVAIPPSLQNMFKELQNDCGCTMPNNGFLEKWAKQGVLLLNTALTVRAGMANSHKDKGWEIFTDRVVELLNKRGDGVLFMLWGANAKTKTAIINNPAHKILTAPHPSPLSAHRGFMGCGHFSAANAWLARNGKSEIDWQIEDD